MSFEDYFSVQVFFLLLRETLETAVIVSVLLAFLKKGFGIDDNGNTQPAGSDDTPGALAEAPDAESAAINRTVYRSLVLQVWVGAFAGLFICLLIGGTFIFVFYQLGHNLWDATEKLWEAVFSILASVMITFLGLAMLRLSHMEAKWRVKVAKLIVETHDGNGHKGGRKWGLKRLSRKYAMALLPFVTTLREGLEAVVFLGGVGVAQPLSSFPLPAISAMAVGMLIGYFMYRSGNRFSIQYFLIGSTMCLYLVAAGLFSRGVWFIEQKQFIDRVGQDVGEMGSGPGSYDITNSVWHVNCCNPETDGLWMVFGALLGWQNSATYGSVISYNLYWVFVIILVLTSSYREKHEGKFPLIPHSWQKKLKNRKKALHLHYTEAQREELVQRAAALYTGGEEWQPLVSDGNGEYETHQLSQSPGVSPRVSQEL